MGGRITGGKGMRSTGRGGAGLSCAGLSCATPGVVALVALGALLLAGCSEPRRDPAARPFFLKVSANAPVSALSAAPVEDLSAPPVPAAPGWYKVIVDLGRGDPLVVECDERDDTSATEAAASGEISCTADGVLFYASAVPSAVVVKARGYEFLESTPDFAGDSAAVTLEPLAPFEADGDGATGLCDQAACLDSLGYPVEGEQGRTLLVKFLLVPSDSNPSGYELHLINSLRHPLHWDYSRDVLHSGLTRQAFEAAYYKESPSRGFAGTLVAYREATGIGGASSGGGSAASGSSRAGWNRPVALTFFPGDTLRPDQVRLVHRLLEARLGAGVPLAGDDGRLVYLPAATDARLDAGQFGRRDVPVVQASEMAGNDTLSILNEGEACGTLRILTAAQLETQVVTFDDILVLQSLPAILPVVAGTLTDAPQTPLSHVNIMARTRGTPNLARPGTSTLASVKALQGKAVRFTARDGAWSLAAISASELQACRAGTEHEPYVPLVDDSDVGLLDYTVMRFEDRARFGVKAANGAELGRLLGEEGPRGFGVPFAWYQRYMTTSQVAAATCTGAREDCAKEGRATGTCAAVLTRCSAAATARQSFDQYVVRLLADSLFTNDALVREAALDGLRHMIRNTAIPASMSTPLEAKVKALFGTAKIRMRSSTNAEDLEQFSGAGLYSSVSANQTKDRVFESASGEIRKVWASTWNWTAFEERRFWNIDHRSVRMGVAVNQSVDDEGVNGVVITQNIADPMTRGYYVNAQLGEASITNPSGSEIPEVSVLPLSIGGAPLQQILQYSSLSPKAPLMSSAEVGHLNAQLYRIHLRFSEFYGVQADQSAFDLEFKLCGPQRQLLVKQIRPYAEWPPR